VVQEGEVHPLAIADAVYQSTIVGLPITSSVDHGQDAQYSRGYSCGSTQAA